MADIPEISTLLPRGAQIRDEYEPEANTAQRVGSLFVDLTLAVEQRFENEAVDVGERFDRAARHVADIDAALSGRISGVETNLSATQGIITGIGVDTRELASRAGDMETSLSDAWVQIDRAFDEIEAAGEQNRDAWVAIRALEAKLDASREGSYAQGWNEDIRYLYSLDHDRRADIADVRGDISSLSGRIDRLETASASPDDSVAIAALRQRVANIEGTLDLQIPDSWAAEVNARLDGIDERLNDMRTDLDGVEWNANDTFQTCEAHYRELAARLDAIEEGCADAEELDEETLRQLGALLV